MTADATLEVRMASGFHQETSNGIAVGLSAGYVIGHIVGSGSDAGDQMVVGAIVAAATVEDCSMERPPPPPIAVAPLISPHGWGVAVSVSF